MNNNSFKLNALSLYAIQGLQFLNPLIVLPILTRNLGIDQFGHLAYWQALIGGLGILVDYGFAYSAVRAIGNAPANDASISTIYWSTLIARLILLAPAIGLLYLVPAILSHSERDLTLQAMGCMSLLGVAISPYWYLTGGKKNLPLAYASIASTLLVLLLTALFVRGKDALYTAAAIQFSAPLVNALFAQWVVYKLAPVARVSIRVKDILGTLRESTLLFITSASAGLYSAINPFLLGLVSSVNQVAYFSIAERISRAARGTINPLMGAMFPYAITNAVEDRARLKHAKIVLIALSLLVAICIVATVPFIIPIVLGSTFKPSVLVSQLLAINVITISISNIFGVQNLIANGRDRPVMIVTLAAAPLHLIAVIMAGKAYGASGAAIAYTVTELVVAIAFFCIATRVKHA